VPKRTARKTSPAKTPTQPEAHAIPAPALLRNSRKTGAPRRSGSAEFLSCMAARESAPFALDSRWLALAIVLCGAVAYLNTLHAPFIFDDRYHIIENARIRQLWPPWTYILHTSRPIIYLSLALNYAIGGLDPLGYHLFNLAIHIAATLLLYGIVRRTFLSSRLRDRFGACAEWLAGFIALVWLVHPLQTESVTYVIQRGESMMGLFYLLTLYCVIRANASTRARWWYAAAAASFAMGIGCKGVMLTAPVIVALYDRVFLAKSWSDLARRRWGLYAALAGACLLYPLLLAQAPVEWKESAGFEYAGASPLQYAITQPGVILHYLQLAFWPAGLCLDYGWPAARTAAEVLPGLLIVGGLLAATIWGWRRHPELAFLGAWFFIILIPTSSFIPIADVAVEHRMYLPLAAVVAMTVAGLFEPLRRLAGARVEWVACALALILLTALTVRRNMDYASELAIWQDTVEKSPGNPRAQYDFGHALEADNRPQEAILHYQKAIEENPNYMDALNNLGHVLEVSGKPQEATGYLQRAIQLKPSVAEAHLNLGYALAQQGKLQEAIAEWQEALRIRPDFAEVHNNLAIALAMAGRTNEAIDHWQQALQLAPDSADTHSNLAYALSQTGKMREAISHYERALRLNPDHAQALGSFAKLLATLAPADGGDANRAIELASRACALTGNRDAGHLETLAIAYAAANRFADAVKIAQDAVEVARTAGRADLAREIQNRLDLYRRGRNG
jgi:tetratricopeptide (TPR) repeat protein